MGCGGADGVLDHAARTCRSEIIKDSSRALARAAEVFGELTARATDPAHLFVVEREEEEDQIT